MKENNIIRSVIDYEYILETPTTPFERQMYIISKLTIKDYISIEELQERLYVSASTVNKDIISAKKWLKENLNLNIVYSLSKGVKLNVTEKEKRNIISWILSYKLNSSTLAKQFNYLFEDKNIGDSANELVNYLGYKINLCGCYTYQQFIYRDKKALEKIEFVVSTSTLADKTNIPFVQINPIIEEKDITNISAYIDYITKKIN